jgi:ATP-dependent Clp protease ATP-binding subunit ClpC
MFERYTEKGRRVIFFARYEASEFGSPCIETEHLLRVMIKRSRVAFFRSPGAVEMIRTKIEGHTLRREKTSTSVDLPISNQCKRVLAYAADEAERLGHNHTDTEHLFLGLLREEKCFAAEILHDLGLRISAVRDQLAHPDDTPLRDVANTAPALSLVAITSTPAGADIEVDDVFLGHTPAELPLDIGERMVTITKKDYQPWQRKLTVLSGGKQMLSADLERLSE